MYSAAWKFGSSNEDHISNRTEKYCIWLTIEENDQQNKHYLVIVTRSFKVDVFSWDSVARIFFLYQWW